MNPFARAFAVVTMAIAPLAIATRPASAIGRPCAQGDVRIAVVVDFGDNASVSVTCVPAGSRDNGAQVLGARAELLGTSGLRFNSSGLLCAIDNVPATGCGDRSSAHYAYWSYWHGVNGSWSYSNFGPAAWRVQADVVEGWRFQSAGAGNPSDPPPRASAAVPSSCRASSTPSAPPATVAPAGTAPGSVPATAAGNTTASAGASGAAPRGVSRTTPVGGAVVSGTSATTRPSAASRSASASTTSSTSTSKRELEQSAAARTRAAGDSDGDGGGGGAPVGLIVGVLLLASLGAGGAIAARRRRSSVSP